MQIILMLSIAISFYRHKFIFTIENNKANILQASKLLTMRLHFQCSEVFDKGIKKCHDKFRDMKVIITIIR